MQEPLRTHQAKLISKPKYSFSSKGRGFSMNDKKNADLSTVDLMKMLIKLQESINLILTALKGLDLRIKAIESQLIETTSEKHGYLLETLDSIQELVAQNDDIPVSRAQIATSMGLSESTIYFRCEKLVERKQIQKFYGRDLALGPAKSVFYSLPRSLYDFESVEKLKNEPGKKIALALLQTQPLSESELSSEIITKKEFEHGITFLLNRGYILQKIEAGGRKLYSIRQN